MQLLGFKIKNTIETNNANKGKIDFHFYIFKNDNKYHTF